MEIRQLRAFVAVAKLHSFTRAANLLNYDIIKYNKIMGEKNE